MIYDLNRIENFIMNYAKKFKLLKVFPYFKNFLTHFFNQFNNDLSFLLYSFISDSFSFVTSTVNLVRLFIIMNQLNIAINHRDPIAKSVSIMKQFINYQFPSIQFLFRRINRHHHHHHY